ncbi:MAG: hypothetical protein EA426_20105 [Spirochaetaceae bacterium]|nr:MAG: hypothetical protein EA426_20105 [Spirochaetaceae bacterium]
MYTPGGAIPPLSVIEGTIGLSEMMFEFLDWNWQDEEADDYEPLPSGVEIDVDESGDNGGTMTITFTGFAPYQDDPNLKIDGEVVLDVTFGEETVTVVKNGSITVTGHAEFNDIRFFDATWIILDSDDNGDENGGGPLDVEMAGSIAFGTVTYQMTDILLAVQAAYTVEGLVGNTILKYVEEYAEAPEEWADSDDVSMEGPAGGPYVITFDEYDPTGGGVFTISGSVTVTVDGEFGTAPLSIVFHGLVTADGFVFETIALNSVEATWDTDADGPPDDISGTMTFDGLTYQAKYLTDILMMFDFGGDDNDNGNGGD